MTSFVRRWSVSTIGTNNGKIRATKNTGSRGGSKVGLTEKEMFHQRFGEGGCLVDACREHSSQGDQPVQSPEAECACERGSREVVVADAE